MPGLNPELFEPGCTPYMEPGREVFDIAFKLTA